MICCLHEKSSYKEFRFDTQSFFFLLSTKSSFQDPEMPIIIPDQSQQTRITQLANQRTKQIFGNRSLFTASGESEDFGGSFDF